MSGGPTTEHHTDVWAVRAALAERLLDELIDAQDENEAAATLTWVLHGTGAVLGAEVLQRTGSEQEAVSIVLARAGQSHGLVEVAAPAGPGLVLRVAEPSVPDVVLEQAARTHARLIGRLAERRRLRTDAHTDPLTGLRNRRSFDDRLVTDLSRLDREGGVLSLLLLDVDDLKAINDSSGHHAGDRVLRRVAASLCDGARASDLVARIGGDEFALLLPGTDAAGAAAMAHRVQSRLLDPRDGSDLSASIGIATTADPTTTPGGMTVAADRALYRAKVAGKARVVVDHVDHGDATDDESSGDEPPTMLVVPTSDVTSED